MEIFAINHFHLEIQGVIKRQENKVVIRNVLNETTVIEDRIKDKLIAFGTSGYFFSKGVQ